MRFLCFYYSRFPLDQPNFQAASSDNHVITFRSEEPVGLVSACDAEDSNGHTEAIATRFKNTVSISFLYNYAIPDNVVPGFHQRWQENVAILSSCC